MKIQRTSIKWFLLVLLIVTTLTKALSQQFTCPSNRACSVEGHGYELFCPADGGSQIVIQLEAGVKAIVQCQVDTTSSDYKVLKDVYIEAGTSLEFRLCPLPEVSFSEIFQLRHANKIQNFSFKSYRSFNNTLRKDLFKGLTGITSLTLANNGLTSLPADLFMDMPHLQHLNLVNNLVQLPENIFQPVLSLESLELGKNEVTNLPVDLFRNLKKLQLLNLWKNKLSNLSATMFQDLTSLTSLDLRHNGLTSLPADIFKYLSGLKYLNLNGNNFKTFPKGLFGSNQKLVTVQMSDSREPNMTLPTGLFSNLPNLKNIDLNNDGLKDIPEDTFSGSTGLVTINLQNNHIKELPPKVFQDATNLEKLNLGYNQIHLLSDNTFEQCKKLKFLDLSHNKISNLTMNALYGLEKLEELRMQDNGLQHIASAFQFRCNLRILNLANNKLNFSEGFHVPDPLLGDFRNSPLRNCDSLEKLDLSNNSIDNIFSDWTSNMAKLRVLNLSHNRLQIVNFHEDAFATLPGRSIEVDVRHNKISILNLSQAEQWASLNHKDPKENIGQRWLLEGNPLSCTCPNYHFFRYLNRAIDPKLVDMVEFVPGNLACAAPKDWIDKPATEVNYVNITCANTPDGAELTCPRPCECAFRVADAAIVVNCSGKNLTEAPAELPTNQDADHTELYLSHNRLHKLPDFARPGYQKVSKLDVAHNNITSLSNITAIPRNIQEIELHNNNLTVVEPETARIFSNLTNLTSITLHHNPWKCDCQLQTLVSFVQVHYKQVYKKILSPKDLKCTDGQLLSNLTASGLCSQTSIVWASLIIALLLGGLIAGMFAVYYRFKHEINAWLFAHNLCLWFVTEEELDKDKLYDAFVSFSQKDEDFVVNELVPNLEGGPIPFKLCLHYRDWVAGEWIPNQITRSVEDSRRTLVVLSPNFLESVWGRMEFRAAHCQALSEGRARVIVVLLGDIGPTENLDPELRAYLNMNTYVKWGDPWFWNKLKYALPHPPKAKKGSIHLVNRNAKNMNGKSNDDKIELICEPNALPPVTTPPAEGNVTDPLSIKNALNGTVSSPRKVPIPSNERNGTAAAVG